MIVQTERPSFQPALEAERHVEALLTEFDRWAASADRQEDGWESDFPQWRELMRQAEQLMAQEHQSPATLFLLGHCWSLSEEDEDCADWAREHLQREHVREMVRRLAGSADPRTRWQTCDVLGNLLFLDAATLKVLETALEDNDAYVRRRAFLALTRHVGGVDPQPYVRRMLLDTDSYNRYVAVQTYYPDAVPEALQAQVDAAAQDPTVVRLLVSEE